MTNQDQNTYHCTTVTYTNQAPIHLNGKDIDAATAHQARDAYVKSLKADGIKGKHTVYTVDVDAGWYNHYRVVHI